LAGGGGDNSDTDVDVDEELELPCLVGGDTGGDETDRGDNTGTATG
jgi:hypothetical protein